MQQLVGAGCSTATGRSRGSRGGIAGAARRRAVVVCMYVWPKSIVCHATLKESRPDAAPRSRVVSCGAAVTYVHLRCESMHNKDTELRVPYCLVVRRSL